MHLKVSQSTSRAHGCVFEGFSRHLFSDQWALEWLWRCFQYGDHHVTATVLIILTFIVTTFFIYAFLRIYGIYNNSMSRLKVCMALYWSNFQLDGHILLVGMSLPWLLALCFLGESPSPILRGLTDFVSSLAFVTFKDNLMVLSLRAMIMQFVFLMIIATFCFCGFFYALWTYVCLFSLQKMHHFDPCSSICLGLAAMKLG